MTKDSLDWVYDAICRRRSAGKASMFYGPHQLVTKTAIDDAQSAWQLVDSVLDNDIGPLNHLSPLLDTTEGLGFKSLSPAQRHDGIATWQDWLILLAKNIYDEVDR